jgi:hypothetical protein
MSDHRADPQFTIFAGDLTELLDMSQGNEALRPPFPCLNPMHEFGTTCNVLGVTGMIPKIGYGFIEGSRHQVFIIYHNCSP